MQKWEYKTLFRFRSWQEEKGKNADWHISGKKWFLQLDGVDVAKELRDLLAELGENGWELVGISTRSSALGGRETESLGGVALDYAGYTTDET